MRSLVLLALLVSTARADEVDLPPVPTAVHAKLDASVARLSTTYRLSVVVGQTSFQLAMPIRGVVTGASLSIDGRRHPLELERHDGARATYDAILADAGGTSRRWAVVLEAPDAGHYLTVTIAAAHRGRVELELAVEAETCFAADRRYVQVPDAWTHADHPILRSTERNPCTGGAIDPDGDSTAWLALPTQEAGSRPVGEQRITASAARLDLPHGHFARVELALARQLTRIAPNLYTVFVIDASRSMTTTALEVQAKTIASYAKRADDSHVQIVAYARVARTLLAGWVVAKRVHFAPPTLANGSNLDAGLAVASRLLASVHGTRRIVVFSDQLVSDRVRALTALDRQLPGGTLVHVVGLEAKTAAGPIDPIDAIDAIERDDTILFADLARATEGLAAMARSTSGAALDALKLVRPIELDHVKLDTPRWHTRALDRAEMACPLDGTERLREGQSCTWWGGSDDDAGGAKLTGLLWNHPIARDLVPTNQPVMLARMLSDESDEVLGAANHEVEQAAMALDREWSMLAQWGGKAGYGDQVVGGGTGWGAICGCGRAGTIGHGAGTGTGRSGLPDTLADQLRRGIAACHLSHAIDVSVELTLNEIVEVDVATTTSSDRDCVTEAVWNVPLVLANPKPHDKRTVAL